LEQVRNKANRNAPANSENELKGLTQRSAQLLKRPHVATRWARQQGSDSVEGDLRLIGQCRFRMTLIRSSNRQVRDAHFAPERSCQFEQRSHSSAAISSLTIVDSRN
jgi:hypothetical protein